MLDMSVFCARGLLAKNKDGITSDSYVVMKLDKDHRFQTVTIKNNINPVWNEDTTFKITSMDRLSSWSYLPLVPEDERQS